MTKVAFLAFFDLDTGKGSSLILFCDVGHIFASSVKANIFDF